jgi:hypothetical protein
MEGYPNVAPIPFQSIVDRAATGLYEAQPARAFTFNQLQEAHRPMQWSRANG